MKYVEQEFEKGPKGPALVQTVNNTVQIQMLDEYQRPSGRVYQFSKSDLALGNFPDGNYSVSISGQGDRLYGIRPLNGSYAVRYTSMAGKEGQLPMPKHFVGMRKDRKKGTDYPVDEMTFNAIAVIESGPYKGMELVLPFLYSRKGSGFVDDGQGGLNYRGGGDKGKLLVTFLEAGGVWGRTLPFSDNVLPMLDSELKNANKQFMAVIQNGWPVAFSDMPDFSQFQNPAQPSPVTPKVEDLDWDKVEKSEPEPEYKERGLKALYGDEPITFGPKGQPETEASKEGDAWVSRVKPAVKRPTVKKAAVKSTKKTARK